MIMRGNIETDDQKARLAEIFVKEHFAKKYKVIDISGENRGKHPYDGTCPNDEPYDVKSSKLYEYGYWSFSLDNINRDEIEWYYLLGFNRDYSELLHAWRIPALMKENIKKINEFIGSFLCIALYRITTYYIKIFGERKKWDYQPYNNMYMS